MLSRVVVKYALLQLPALAALAVVLVVSRHFLQYPLWVSVAVFLGWVLKDILMFPLTKKAYVSESGENLEGLRAVVVKELCPVGYVKVNGELWLAESTEPGAALDCGQYVIVSGRRGHTLLVQPED